MESLRECLESIPMEEVYKLVYSAPLFDNAAFQKIVIEDKQTYLLAAKYTKTQVFHEKLEREQLLSYCQRYLQEDFTRLHAWSSTYEYALKRSKKGKFFLSRKKAEPGKMAKMQPAHNRKKQYIFEEGSHIPPLTDMGIFTASGKVVQSMYDKYKQINRFIELIDDAVKKWGDKELRIIDFGCGKSYLSFLVYHYLHEIRKIKVHMLGLDLKEEVIEKCRLAARKYGYENLHFAPGDIRDYEADFPVDMVISLHACDTATDYALYNAVRWKAKMIFCVPCCQHELAGQMQSGEFALFSRYGIVKDRFAALMTDAIRANLLEYMGYDTQVLEFIDMAHTPKNILLRAVHRSSKSAESRERAKEEAEKVMHCHAVKPSLYSLLECENVFT